MDQNSKFNSFLTNRHTLIWCKKKFFYSFDYYKIKLLTLTRAFNQPRVKGFSEYDKEGEVP